MLKVKAGRPKKLKDSLLESDIFFYNSLGDEQEAFRQFENNYQNTDKNLRLSDYNYYYQTN